MRAVVLGDEDTIGYLNANFVNLCVLNLDLKRRRDAEGIDGVSPLERVIIGGWNEESPVDCQVISNELKLLGSLPINDFIGVHSHYKAQDYRDYLSRSLAVTSRETWDQRRGIRCQLQGS